MKFCHLIPMKIIKCVATRYQILRLKCTKFDFDWGSAPDPTGGAYSAPPDPLAGYKGAYLRGPAVEHWSLADVLSLTCDRLVADG